MQARIHGFPLESDLLATYFEELGCLPWRRVRPDITNKTARMKNQAGIPTWC